MSLNYVMLIVFTETFSFRSINVTVGKKAKIKPKCSLEVGPFTVK